jgi:hypothetical protein
MSITQDDLEGMDEAALARFAARLPGFTLVRDTKGLIYFTATSWLDEMNPVARAELTVIPRIN